MTVFKPNGTLNVATEPTDLPEVNFARCKNLALDNIGRVETRKGSSKLNQTAMNDKSVNSLEVQAGDRYSFGGDQIYENESSIATGLTDAQWSSIKYNAFNEDTQQVFCLNGTDRKRIEGATVYEWGQDAPTERPTVYATPDDDLSGTYSIKFTHVRKTSAGAVVFESDPSPKSFDVTSSNYQLVGEITRPNQTDITHVRVYRTVANGGAWFLDDEYSTPYLTSADEIVFTQTWEGTYGNSKFTTTDEANSRDHTYDWEADFSDNATDDNMSFMRSCFRWEGVRYCSGLSDALLGAEVEATHARPPLGTFVLGPNYNGTCFIIKDNLLYYCLPKQPEHWPATYFIEVGTKQFPGVAMVFYNGQPYYLTKNDIYYIQGTGHPVFQPLSMKARTGAQGPQGAYVVDGHGIYHTGSDGLYLFAGGNDRKVTESNFDPIFKGESKGGMPAASELTTAWLIAFKNKLYFGYTSSGNSYPTNVIVMNLDEPRRATYYEYPFEIRSVAIDESNDRLLAGCNDGFVRVLETGTQDDQSEISWEIRTKDYTLQTRKHFPRWAKYDIDASNANSVTAQILLDDSSIQSHTITDSRKTHRRLIDTNNGDRVSINVTGNGPATIYAAEFE